MPDSDGNLLVLVVDDEQIIADTIVQILNMNGFNATAAYSGESAIVLAHTLRPSVLISDVFMNEMSGAELAVRVIRELPGCKIFLLSGQVAMANHLKESVEIGDGFELLSKPLDPNVLLHRLKECASIDSKP
jgi:CheY-like chemotaxis protein